MSIQIERIKGEKALNVLRQIMDEEVLITNVSLASHFSLRKLSRVQCVTIVTDTRWTFEMVMEESGVSFVRSAIGPDGQPYLTARHPVTIHDWLTGPEKAALDTEIEAALTSTIPK